MVRLEIHQKLTSRSHVLSLVLSKTEDILYHGVLFWSYPTHSQNGPYGMYISDFSRRFEADFTTSSLSLQYGIRLLLCKTYQMHQVEFGRREVLTISILFPRVLSF
jgi:hypothetical protein